ncbi:MAG: tetratricopeptide repeat protein [Deltaproteobacteria bacterium]|nr:tetratricopeptide repeat protein [Deltaproteobacteria bacterium]
MSRRTSMLLVAVLLALAVPAFAGKQEEIDRLFSEAASLESHGQWSLASSNYSKILDQDPENALAHYRLATCQVRVGMNDYAIKHFDEAIRIDPNLKEAREGLEGVYVTRGLLARQNGKRSEALAAFEKAAQANPASATAALELGDELEKQGQPARAEEVYARAASASPDDAATHAKLGAVFAERGMNERAATELETAVRLNPRDAASHKTLGYVYAALGKRDRAVAAFHEAMRQYVLVGDMVGGTEAESLEKKAKAGQPLGASR